MELTRDDNEEERLRELKSFRILDTLPETCFDQLTQLAARVCETPIALLSFIDENRQWFKSAYGMEIKEIPRHVSACNQTIVHFGVYEIPDSEDLSCPYREFMMAHGLRFYAGVPITSKEGHSMGALCVIDTRPRKLTEDQLTTLRAIGEQIVEDMEIRRRYQENLERLREFGELHEVRDKKMMDVVHKRAHKAIAEVATGLAFRVRPYLLNIKSNAHLLKNTVSTAESKAHLKSVERSVSSIADIFDHLEKFVTAEKEKWMKLVELQTVIHEVLFHLEHKIKRQNITVKLDLENELRCVGNYAKLIEVVYGVVNNAIEAIDDRKDGIIEISLKQDKRKAIILVKDNGIGIEENSIPFIFQPFYTTKTHPALGIGLCLVKSHLEEHSGHIELEKNYSPTTFKITIPIPA